MTPTPGSLEALHGDALQRGADRIWRTTSVRAANTEAIWSLLRATVFAVLLTRASSDPIFNLLGGDAGASSMGVGALLNVLAIAIAFALLVQAPLRAPFPVFAIWGRSY